MTTDHPAALPSAPIVQLPAPALKSSLKRNVPTRVETFTMAGLLFTSGDEMVIVSEYEPFARDVVLGETVSVEGAVPDVALSPSHVEDAVADQPKTPVPRLLIWIVRGLGFNDGAPKKFNVVGVTLSTAVFTASVTGIVSGEFDAPGTYTVKVPLYVPSDRPAGFAFTVSTPGVRVEFALAVSHAALLVVANVVAAPPAVMLTVCAGGVLPGIAANVMLDGDGVSIRACA